MHSLVKLLIELVLCISDSSIFNLCYLFITEVQSFIHISSIEGDLQLQLRNNFLSSLKQHSFFSKFEFDEYYSSDLLRKQKTKS
jgi:hypothetical protein